MVHIEEKDGNRVRANGHDPVMWQLIRAWWPAVIWAILISYASTDTFSSQNTGRFMNPLLQWLYPFVTQPQQDAINFFVRKCAHFTEYFVFYLLVLRGLALGRPGWSWSRALGAWCIVAAYSGLDEFHQSFIASRTASPWDSLLDSTGALIAMLTAFLGLRFFWRSSGNGDVARNR
jgi:VanZ family protein